MNAIVDKTHDLMSQSAARIMADAIRRKPDLSMLVATGNTPIDSYRHLAKLVNDENIDASGIIAVQLDEYLGIGPEDPRSLFGWMDRDFIRPLGIDNERVIRFDAIAEDPQSAIDSYDRMVEAIGGIDLAVLGLGPNGHLGFNEPPSFADSPTRIVDLTPESIASNSRYWGDDAVVPTRAFTAGMTTILAARQILLVTSGSHKCQILRKTIRGPVTELVPSSLLQTVSEKVTVLADDGAWEDCEPA
jgi:glucosamine-6-phosphate deaminase